MREAHGNVVPFERPASYWAHRARWYDAHARQPEAARMMRKALEKDHAPGTALELARIYAGMECYTAAERCLVREVNQHGMTGSACFLIGVCALARWHEPVALAAFEKCLRLDPMGEYADAAMDYLQRYPWQNDVHPPRTARSLSLCRRAREAFLAGDKDTAGKLSSRAWKMGKTCPGASLQGILCEPREAIPYFLWITQERPWDSQAWLALARTYFDAGHKREARISLIRAGLRSRNITQSEYFCTLAWNMGEYALALRFLQGRLRQFPSSAEYWRLQYLTCRNMGRWDEAARALATWLDLDPDDPAAIWHKQNPDDLRVYEGRGMMLAILGRQLADLPSSGKRGPLNRMLHRLCVMLNHTLDETMIYRLLPPLWKRLSAAEKRACDREEEQTYALALAVYLLRRTGWQQDADTILAAASGRRRINRLVKKFISWQEEGH
ncbi:MAG: tetratricopeptide repeat protein [Clostridia bacterium]|nr:tetratricopeptide repeat protein [Clostridia bacterium]